MTNNYSNVYMLLNQLTIINYCRFGSPLNWEETKIAKLQSQKYIWVVVVQYIVDYFKMLESSPYIEVTFLNISSKCLICWRNDQMVLTNEQVAVILITYL